MQEILGIEVLLKFWSGMGLLLAPSPLLQVLGLPRDPSGFWPRLLGAALIGVAGAIYVEGRLQASQGLGTTGLVILNFSVAAFLFAHLVLGNTAPTRRGRLVVGGLGGLLVLLGLCEIAWI